MTARFDPADPAFRADPYPVYDELRRTAPVLHVPEQGCWIVTGHAAMRALLRDSRVGAQRPQRPVPSDARLPPFLRARDEALALFRQFLPFRAQADHRRLRRLVAPSFTEAAVAARRADVQRRADALLDRAEESGRFDVIGDLARPVALATAADVLGFPQDVREEAGQRARDLAGEHETAPLRERAVLAMIALAATVREVLAAGPPERSVLGRLDAARRAGELTEEEVVAHGALLLFAGYLTSQHLMGNGLLALMEHPEQWALLRARPELLPPAVEELVRYDGPVAAARRTTLDDVVHEQTTIPRGATVLLLLGAANRDPAAFAAPGRLDVTRSPNPHFGFGGDAHYCVGAALGRLEAEIVVGAVLRRFVGLRPAGDAKREELFVIRGLESLPVEVA